MNAEGENTVVMVLGAGHLDGVEHAFNAGVDPKDIAALCQVGRLLYTVCLSGSQASTRCCSGMQTPPAMTWKRAVLQYVMLPTFVLGASVYAGRTLWLALRK